MANNEDLNSVYARLLTGAAVGGVKAATGKQKTKKSKKSKGVLYDGDRPMGRQVKSRLKKKKKKLDEILKY